MNELKERMLGQSMNEYGCDTKIYLKSEADKVIKEKDKEIARLDDLAHAHNIELLRKENLIAEVKAKLESVQATAYAESVDAGMENLKLKRAMWLARAANVDIEYYPKSEADKVIAHHKYKRCLAMADKCVDLCHKAKDLYRWAEDENLEHHYNHKIEFFARWHKRWLKLAEKYKEGNV